MRWRKVRGDTITLFYPVNEPTGEIALTPQSFDTVLAEVTDVLGVEPLRFRVPVYLFPDAPTLNKWVARDSAANTNAGYSHGDAISLSGRQTSDLLATAAHEFTHVLLYQRVSKEAYGLLDEGLSCYVASLLGGTIREGGPLPISWQTMARYTVFHQALYTKKPEYPNHQAYAYAASLAAFLIESYDISRYLDLCRESVSDKEHLAGEKLAEAVQDVYGRSVADLEAEWRSSYEAPQQYAETTRGAMRNVRRIAIQERFARAREARRGGQQTVDFGCPRPSRRH